MEPFHDHEPVSVPVIGNVLSSRAGSDFCVSPDLFRVVCVCGGGGCIACVGILSSLYFVLLWPVALLL